MEISSDDMRQFIPDDYGEGGMKGAVETAIELVYKFSSIGGEHHKQWLLDKVIMALTGNCYEAWVRNFNLPDTVIEAERGEVSYEWDKGITP